MKWTLAALLLLTRYTFADPVPVTITIDPSTTVATIPDDFLGFGYESSAAAQTGFFSPDNRSMIRLYQNLTPHGLVRIGGNISDHTVYEPDAPSAVRSERDVTVINHKNLDDLGQFLHAAGWKLMWGLNLGTGTKEDAVTEAVAVDTAVGDALQSLQIGNEVDLMRKYSKDYPAYHAAYADWKAAIREKLPKSVFSGPDSANSLSLVEQFAGNQPGEVALLTHHYYRAGMSDKVNATMDNLLRHDDKWDDRLTELRRIADGAKSGYRINEINSFSGGGKPDVSDTFASALWALDYCFTCAAHGCAGVNMETDINQHAFTSSYSPIVRDTKGVCHARPEYYGLVAFAAAGRGNVIGVKLDKPEINLTAYATKDRAGVIRVVVINKDSAGDAAVTIAAPPATAVDVVRLTAPAIDAKTGVTFAGKAVAEDGSFTPGPSDSVAPQPTTHFQISHASALVVTFTK